MTHSIGSPVRKSITDSGIATRFTAEGREMSILEVFSALADSADSRSLFTESIAAIPFDAFYWEAVPISQPSRNSIFEFVQTNASPLAGSVGDPGPFANQFEGDKVSSILSFKNLGGDATLIVPRPISDVSAYGHLAAFLRNGLQSQVDAFWKRTAETILADLSTSPIWLSTAGLGVPWLHLRLDSRPKYFRHTPYTQLANGR